MQTVEQFAAHSPGLLHCRAVFLGQRLEIKQFRYASYLAVNPLTLSYGQQGTVVLFRYGVVVIYGLSALEETRLLEELAPYVRDPIKDIEEESLQIRRLDAEEGFFEGVLQLTDLSVERLQLLADVLAKSVVLSFYEHAVATTFDQVEPLANNLRARGRGSESNKELLKRIGEILSIQSKMVGRVEVGDKPDLLWEFPQLEKLYQRMETEFEIRERHLALERKFMVITRATQTMLDLLQHNRSLRVEWYIVILILVDILISLGSKLF